MRAATRSITIDVHPAWVFEFVSNPVNLPLWSRSFCLSVFQHEEAWFIESPHGPIQVYMQADPETGVIDQYLYPTPEIQVLIPMRVVPNQSGTEFIFTLFQPDDISEEDYQQEIYWVEQELQTLKKLLEEPENIPN
ncbi:hypothetical protein COW36_13550 [bacterium (Candidatus Blackallbacteria) CG17_big_fil_post_rev_8_21_14_2_50_48_46]|uniref:Polyketide cyclase n=1 Tax=bacterium (Candidatus Blackallbacteria) CG17_big_fil_post_rev_8_21_14_2_50_48_46 TaxID=2014261 RepID=A0A2M7G3D7_9BACT|nr:MAG: hypothetical protein COW64_22170 [bacterium (Candidatus Blackallbacteria) CG18_big_fil_WC_8_21_14_2_50_49_26]PIW16349.1 MAG: hypothetical protein COW36_13550 [bacterium (Candidatus Blackallbacteria) CG17_big_fil_post_rev_8_21_14_2_50_48_46]PIW45363.1 MAG: hypothetical protein COW20_20785 [bacterium (Candidatus Blackallbacteria) CG13_big_fil_rev_8_21_14_2_50_49_14]